MDQVQQLTVKREDLNTIFHTGRQSSQVSSHWTSSLTRITTSGSTLSLLKVDVEAISAYTNHLVAYWQYQRRKRDQGLLPRSLLLINGASKQLRTTFSLVFPQHVYDRRSLSEINELINVLRSEHPMIKGRRQLICLRLLIEYHVGTLKGFSDETLVC